MENTEIYTENNEIEMERNLAGEGMLHIVSKTVWFSAAHILNYEEKCGRLHGHNYKAHIQVSGNLIVGGMVINFDEISNLVKELDHHLILAKNQVKSMDEDTVTFEVIKPNKKVKKYTVPREDVIILNKVAITAELLSEYLVYQCMNLLKDRYGHYISEPFKHYAVEISLEETPSSVATFAGSEVI
jgi:6-pyruvoyltetrahydropterin/6-carboxytetrahydropterin synthase